jgi:hypothetical protein
MERSELAIATISLARDREEERLLRRSLSFLDTLAIPTFIADGGSPDSFVAELRSIASVRLVAPSAGGLVAQARASVLAAAASGARRVLYTEPDKESFFTQHLERFLDAAPDDDSSGVVIAARDPAALATFPSMQRTTESAINAVCGELSGVHTDYCYGPFLLHPELAAHFDSIPDDLGWGWRFVMFLAAHRMGMRIDIVEGAFECPVDQRDESPRDRLYRITQLEQNVRGTLIGERVDIHHIATRPCRRPTMVIARFRDTSRRC